MFKDLNVVDLTPKEEIDRRIEDLRRGMAEKGMPYAVILQTVDLFYFTGTAQKGALVVPVDGAPKLFIERSLERAVQETPLEVVSIKRDKEVKNFFPSGVFAKGPCGMELDVLPVALFNRWQSILGFDEVADVSPLIRDVRSVKSPFEIEQIRRSGLICSRVFAKVPEVIREGMMEIEVAAELEAEGRRAGHQGILRMRGFNQEMASTFVTHGYSSTVPSSGDVPISGLGVTHAVAQGPSVSRIGKGIPVLLDYGGAYNGYITDETRVYCIGEMKESFRKAFAVSKEIVEDTTDWAREGVLGSEIFGRAFEKVERAGLKDYFMGYGPGQVSFVGHGLGLEINELPVITPRHHVVIREGMVFAFEPKFIFPGEGAVGLEVDYIVRKDRLERVTDAPIDIVYL